MERSLAHPMHLHYLHRWLHLSGIQCLSSHRLRSKPGAPLQRRVSKSHPNFISLIFILPRIVLTTSIYMCLHQLVYIKPVLARHWRWIVWGVIMLLPCTVIPLISQGTSNFFNPDASPSLRRSDRALMEAGVILLLVFNVIFLGILVAFHLSCSRAAVFAESANRNIKLFVFMLYAIATLILARNIFRTVQIFSPSDSPAWRVQAFFWVFDASPLLISTVLLNALHPGKLVQSMPCYS
jgi:hypothetical protein